MNCGARIWAVFVFLCVSCAFAQEFGFDMGLQERLQHKATTNMRGERKTDSRKSVQGMKTVNKPKGFDSLLEEEINGMGRKAPKAESKSLGDEDDDEDEPEPRSAMAGIMNTIMVILTFVSFIGNGIFLVHVFWFKDLGHVTNQSATPIAAEVVAKDRRGWNWFGTHAQ